MIPAVKQERWGSEFWKTEYVADTEDEKIADDIVTKYIDYPKKHKGHQKNI